MMRWTPLTVLVVGVALAMVLAVRGGALDADGPLHDPDGFGGVEIDAAGHGESQWLTAGEIFLCTEHDGSWAELRGVRVGASVPAERTRVYVRRVPAVDLTSHGTVPDGFEPIIAVRGLPQDFVRPKGRHALGIGDWSTHVAGLRITQTCRDQERVGHGYTELFVSIQAGEDGAQVQDIWVDYDSDHGRATVHAHGSVIICGRAITEPGVCDNPDE